MQQATHNTDSVKSTEAVPTVATGSVTSSFVINLCSSTSPVALAPPDHAGLKRFTFFVSRRREDGRERFRLHMGYFPTQEEAEKLLDIVREIYPGAWAGLAPGQRLRAAASGRVVPVPVPVPVQVAPPVASIPAISVAAPAVVAPVIATPAVAAAVAVAVAAPAAAPENAATPALALPVASEVISSENTATRSLIDVRAAIAALDDSAPADGFAVIRPVLRIPELKAATGVRGPTPTTSATPNIPAAKPLDVSEVISGERAIALLESPTPALDSSPPVKGVSQAAGDKDTPNPDKPVFAVQLMWSVQPIDMNQVPQLAIFSAYTLYGAEGNREGRRWYGLRLGFFTDAVSAKQVAHYVRSEFSTVSVVPVTPRERARASQVASRTTSAPPPQVAIAAATAAAAAAKAAAPAPAAAPRAVATSPAFEFIEDKLQPSGPGPGDGRLPSGPRSGRGAPGKRARLRTGTEVAGSKTRKLTLEETLEILGADSLAVDEGRGELLNDESAAGPASQQRTKPAKPTKSSRLGRLFERLSERIGN